MQKTIMLRRGTKARTEFVENSFQTWYSKPGQNFRFRKGLCLYFPLDVLVDPRFYLIYWLTRVFGLTMRCILKRAVICIPAGSHFLTISSDEKVREFCWWRCKDILKPVRRIMPRCLYLSAHLKMFHQLIQNLRFIYIGVFRDISWMTIAKWCLIISSQSNLTRSIRNNVYFVTFRRHSWHLSHTKSPV